MKKILVLLCVLSLVGCDDNNDKTAKNHYGTASQVNHVYHSAQTLKLPTSKEKQVPLSQMTRSQWQKATTAEIYAKLETVDNLSNVLPKACAYVREPDIISKMIAKGANVNAKDEEGRTALMYAMQKDSYDIIDILLKAGANPNARDKTGRNVLFFIDSHTPYYLINNLIKAGASVNARDENFYTPLTNYLIAGHNIQILDLLIKSGADVHDTSTGFSVLYWPIKFGQFEIVKYLIANKVSVNGKPMSMTASPLRVAIESKNIEMIDLLLTHGADINKPESLGRTPLSSAIEAGVDINIVEHLLKKGANVNATTYRCVNSMNRDCTILEMAVKADREPEVIRLLIKYGAKVTPEILQLASPKLRDTDLYWEIKDLFPGYGSICDRMGGCGLR